MKKLLVILLAALMLPGSVCAADEGNPADAYAVAWEAAWSGEYALAARLFVELGDYADSAELAYLLGVSRYADEMTPMDEASVIAFRFHGKWGLINLEERLLIAPVWDEMSAMNEEKLAKVRINGLFGYVNAKGASVIECEWEGVSDFASGLCTVMTHEGSSVRYGLMNAQGELVASPVWLVLGDSRDGAIAAPDFVSGRIVVGKYAGYGIMDEAGQLLGEACWDEEPDLTMSFPIVQKNGRFGFINLDGEVIVPAEYESVKPFSDGLAAVSSSPYRWGFVDTAGTEVIPQVYAAVTPFSDGAAHVTLSGMTWQIIDKSGQLLYFITPQISADYETAVAMMAQGDYAGAVALLSGTIGYRDSYALLQEARRVAPLKAEYDAGAASFEEGRYVEAIDAFGKASGYMDADLRKEATQEVVYQQAAGLMAAEDYRAAATAFSGIADYRDSAARAEECKRLKPLKTQYDKAVSRLAEGKYADAIAAFGKASGYKDADVQRTAAQEIVYQKAMELMAAGDYASAAAHFEVISGYRDSAEQAAACIRLAEVK